MKTVISNMFSSAKLQSLQRGDLLIKAEDIIWASIMKEGSLLNSTNFQTLFMSSVHTAG